MTETNKTQRTAERVKGIVYGFIGAIFFIMGILYFGEQSSYAVPRILLPIWNLLGSIGLAISLLLLGGGFMMWGYNKFTKYGGKKLVPLIVFPIFILIGYGVMKLTEKTYTPDLDEGTGAVTAGKDEPTSRPKMDDPMINDYFDQLEQLSKDMKIAKDNNDKARFDELDNKYSELNMLFSDKIVPTYAKRDEYRSIVMYNAHVAESINEMRMSK